MRNVFPVREGPLVTRLATGAERPWKQERYSAARHSARAFFVTPWTAGRSARGKPAVRGLPFWNRPTIGMAYDAIVLTLRAARLHINCRVDGPVSSTESYRHCRSGSASTWHISRIHARATIVSGVVKIQINTSCFISTGLAFIMAFPYAVCRFCRYAFCGLGTFETTLTSVRGRILAQRRIQTKQNTARQT